MNRKGMVFLYICAAAFIISIFIFYGSIGDQTPGHGENVLGQAEIEVFETYQEAEADAFYFEQAARVAASQVERDTFVLDFGGVYGPYLEGTDLSIDDFTFSYDLHGDLVTIVAVASKELEYDENYYQYSITPSFSVTTRYKQATVDEGFIA